MVGARPGNAPGPTSIRYRSPHEACPLPEDFRSEAIDAVASAAVDDKRSQGEASGGQSDLAEAGAGELGCLPGVSCNLTDRTLYYNLLHATI